MDEQDYINLVRATNFIRGIGDQTNSNSTITVLKDARVEVRSDSKVIELNGSGVVELADFYIDFPEAEMSMNPEDITGLTKQEGPISYDDLVEKYEIAVKKLQRYLGNIDALADHLVQETITFPTGSESAAELRERLTKDKKYANKLVSTIQEALAQAKEQADGKTVIEPMGGKSLS